jgi:hypothetical protein
MSGLVGGVLALWVAVFARWSGLDRDRAFYPTVLIVIASYYVLFAAMGGSTSALVIESMIMGVFALGAVAGLKRNLWTVAAALAAHGVMDLFHARFVDNPGVPEWWPGFCLAYDVVAAATLGWLIRSAGRTGDAPPRDPLAAGAPRTESGD